MSTETGANSIIISEAVNIERDLTAIMSEAASLSSEALALVIDSPERYTGADEVLKRVKAKYKALEEDRKSITKPLDESKALIMDKYRPHLEMLKRAEGILKRGLIAFEERLEAIERKKQEEADRLAAEERKKAEALAKRAEKRGNEELAEEHRERAEEIIAPKVVVEKPKLSGSSSRQDWDFEIVDEKAIPREYLSVDESKIRRYVKLMKSDAKIAGVRVFPKKVFASRSL